MGFLEGLWNNESWIWVLEGPLECVLCSGSPGRLDMALDVIPGEPDLGLSIVRNLKPWKQFLEGLDFGQVALEGQH